MNLWFYLDLPSEIYCTKPDAEQFASALTGCVDTLHASVFLKTIFGLWRAASPESTACTHVGASVPFFAKTATYCKFNQSVLADIKTIQKRIYARVNCNRKQETKIYRESNPCFLNHCPSASALSSLSRTLPQVCSYFLYTLQSAQHVQEETSRGDVALTGILIWSSVPFSVCNHTFKPLAKYRCKCQAASSRPL